ncbi:hypothetical protein HDV02_004115 [Globomyces sp. JEL0801]|nr:hypothetical protein HDV02_004115 [Globomyces sp. JEL0801]
MQPQKRTREKEITGVEVIKTEDMFYDEMDEEYIKDDSYYKNMVKAIPLFFNQIKPTKLFTIVLFGMLSKDTFLEGEGDYNVGPYSNDLNKSNYICNLQLFNKDRDTMYHFLKQISEAFGNLHGIDYPIYYPMKTATDENVLIKTKVYKRASNTPGLQKQKVQVFDGTKNDLVPIQPSELKLGDVIEVQCHVIGYHYQPNKSQAVPVCGIRLELSYITKLKNANECPFKKIQNVDVDALIEQFEVSPKKRKVPKA